MEQPLDSARDVYRALGVVALLVATVYLALYHLLLAPRCAAPAVSPPQHLLQGTFISYYNYKYRIFMRKNIKYLICDVPITFFSGKQKVSKG